MIVPISLGDKHLPGACMLLLNRYSTGEDSLTDQGRKFINFNAYSILASSKLFQNLLEHAMRYFVNLKIEQVDKHTESEVLDLIDQVMGSTSLHEF